LKWSLLHTDMNSFEFLNRIGDPYIFEHGFIIIIIKYNTHPCGFVVE